MTDPSTEQRLLPIGELSRASGLTVSALRFYDREGLLVPADVDPGTGYRRYSPGQVRPARLLAGMRRVGMPLAEMAAVLAALPDVEVAEDLLAAHLRRLEDGLRDARREVERLETLLPGRQADTWTAQVEAGELSRALDAVRHAVASDPDFPMLCGILVEPIDTGVRLVSTDRFRLAIADAPATGGPAEQGVWSWLAANEADRLRAALRTESTNGIVRLDLGATGFVAHLPGGSEVTGACLELDFPDYRRLLDDRTAPGKSTRIPVAEILSDLAARQASGGAPAHVALHPDGVREDGEGLLLDRAFLWDAANAARDGHAVLPLGEEIQPLVFHGPDDALVGLLMPVLPQAPR